MLFHNINKKSIKRIFCCRQLAFIFFLSLLSGNALAEPSNFQRKNYPDDFSLSFSFVDTDLSADSVIYPINQRRISVSLYSSLNPYLAFGLNLGSTYLGLDNDTATSGLNLNGNHIGFTINGVMGINPQLVFRAHYLYQEARDSDTTRSASLTWLEWVTEVSLRVKFGPYWGISVGGGFNDIDVRRRVSGAIKDTLNLKQEENLRGQLTLDLYTEPDGRVSLILNRGAHTGTELVFARDF